VEELLCQVDASLSSKVDRTVIAGEGEPTVRMDALLALMQELHGRHLDIRVNTNGLVSEPGPLLQAAIECQASFTVALMTADEEQDEELMQPTNHDHAHACVVQFIRSAVQMGLSVETTAVQRPEVDIPATEALAKELGTALRWRPYFP